ncbi:flagellar hook-associated protein FlgK [Amphritea balenae]|uniref:Flagellar hook-associated protein 1 n=1 Tax=Amphritea balenae TaxID=452629 RepID=A0A3P1SRG7_9GAMM|nr:flagellar hook-associated protein FlgK [Amphritea balenae]RRC99255.1 flagellar hook-associated protein FlgK [Amphritea balenae]GGK72682.1 flagellar hook-associated protein FlgK [Amphritea balenae]
MSSFDLLNLGTQSMLTNQSQLNTVGQNISNANTDGYSRQRVNQVSLEDRTGVFVNDIQRITDSFLTKQLWADQAVYSQTETFSNLANQVDDLLASGTSSVSNALDNFFGAMQSVVDSPLSMPSRELFIAETDSLVRRFNDLDSNVRRLDESVDTLMGSLADQVSVLASNVAGLNEQIRVAVTQGSGANELQDQRDLLIQDISELVGITVIEQSDSQLNLFVGNGQPLVVGGNSNQLMRVSGDAYSNQSELKLMIGGRLNDVTDEVSGGQIGGLLQYRDEVINEVRDQLGLLAISFAETMNQQHQSGMDLNNNLGENIFNDVNVSSAQFNRVTANADNLSGMNSATVLIEDVSQLHATDYELVYNGPNDISIIRNSDGVMFNSSDFTAETGATVSQGINAVDQGEIYFDPDKKAISVAFDGIKVTIETDTQLTTGDRFLLTPVRTGADDLQLKMVDAEKLALASPVRVTPDTTNDGTGIAYATVTDPTGLAFANSHSLTPPVDVVFNNTDPLTYTLYDISQPDNPQVLDLGAGPLANQTFVAGEEIQLEGFSVRIENTPKAGDRFRFEYNLDGFSDNRNALELSGLQNDSLTREGSYQDIYGGLVEWVGSRTATASIAVQANKAVLDTTVGAKASVSGVNLDEEAAKLVQYQQAYQASAQLIRVSQTIFDSLLSSI